MQAFSPLFFITLMRNPFKALQQEWSTMTPREKTITGTVTFVASIINPLYVAMSLTAYATYQGLKSDDDDDNTPAC